MNKRLHEVLRKYPERAAYAQLLKHLNDRPRSDYELASALGLDYRAVQDQLSVLLNVDLVRTDARLHENIYLLTDEARQWWNTIEAVIHLPVR